MPRAWLASVFLLLVACDEARSVRPSEPSRCVAGARRCSGTNLMACNAAGTYFTARACADEGLVCGTVSGTISGCIDDRCSTGATGGRCNDGSACTAGSECVSGACSAAGVCTPAGCTNGRQDGTESGPDCGGTCPLCFGAA